MKISITGSPSTVSVIRTFRTPSQSTTVSAMGFAHGISETYSRKVFVGGLPRDIDEGDLSCAMSWLFIIFLEEIHDHFVQFGTLNIDWPHRAQSKAYFPPQGIQIIVYTLFIPF